MKKIFNFETMQKFSKTLMVVVAVMPAAGIAIAIGKSGGMLLAGNEYIAVIFSVLEQSGWAIIGHLPILFVIAIGGSWAKEKSGGSLAALIVYLVMLQIMGTLAQVGLSPDELSTWLPFVGNVAVDGYLVQEIGITTINMSVFGGIVAGFVGAMLYNKFYKFNKLPVALAFFNGKRFVPFVAIIAGIVLGSVFFVIWPPVQGVINAIGIWLTSVTIPFLAPFIYGTLERLLLPFGLHHLLTIPMNYTALGGEYTGICTANTAQGQELIWYAWIDDLSCAINNGSQDMYNQVLVATVPARFKVGQVLTTTFSLPAAAFAMWSTVDKDKKKKYAGFYFAAALPVFLTGISEPLEFLFIFISPVLWVVHALLTGVAFALADLVPLRLHAFGFIEVIAKTPLMVSVGLTQDMINFIICGIFMALVYYFVFRALIIKLNIPIPGRKGNFPVEEEEIDNPIANKEENLTDYDPTIVKIYQLLGEKDNIVDVDACMTRLRVSVKDPSLVGQESEFKKTGAIGLFVKDTGVQVVYGPKADTLKSELQDYLEDIK